MKTVWRCFASALLLVSAASLPLAVPAADTKPKGSQVTITRAEAEKTALLQVPGGSTISGKLERDKGRRVWSFDIAMPNSRDITEVHIDARTGAVLATAIETPEEQAREAAAERKKAK
jgi:hypothetical protein